MEESETRVHKYNYSYTHKLLPLQVLFNLKCQSALSRAHSLHPQFKHTVHWLVSFLSLKMH